MHSIGLFRQMRVKTGLADNEVHTGVWHGMRLLLVVTMEMAS